MSSTSFTRTVKRFCIVLIAFGTLMKLYGLSDPWKRHDHYNFGGIVTSAYAECLKSTPLAISHGIPHFLCWTDAPVYYRAHPPTILFAMWGWTSIFGSAEWSYRLFIFFFSSLNIGLIYMIAREVRRGLFPWLAAMFQSVFLGNMYFGTHLDFIGEFTVFFVLLMALAALRGRLTWAGFLALLAGISSWPGYIAFAPLWLYALTIRHGRVRVFFLACFGFLLALATMMWLHQTTDITDFLRKKLFDPGYIKPHEKGWTEPLRFVHNFLTSQARLLSPLFATLAFWELWLILRNRIQLRFMVPMLTRFEQALLLSGGTGLIYALVGHEYFMVHVYLYLLMTPALALLAGQLVERAIESSLANAIIGSETSTGLRLKWFLATAIIFIAVYPYGIFKSNAVHDALTSIALALTALTGVYMAWQRTPGPRPILFLVAFGALANASQLINYRNEPDTERSFCEEARAEFSRTGQTVVTHEERSDAKDLVYCKGLPIRYLDQNGKDQVRVY